MVLAHKDSDDSFEVSDSSDGLSDFTLVSGLSGKSQIVSLVLGRKKWCFIYSGVNYKAGTDLKVSCNSDSDEAEAEFNQVASLTLQNGISKYHPISFVVKGQKRNFLLPLRIIRLRGCKLSAEETTAASTSSSSRGRVRIKSRKAEIEIVIGVVVSIEIEIRPSVEIEIENLKI
ncbi:hypothetical protein ACFE04_021207 [Oxalis oulophora]